MFNLIVGNISTSNDKTCNTNSSIHMKNEGEYLYEDNNIILFNIYEATGIWYFNSVQYQQSGINL